MNDTNNTHNHDLPEQFEDHENLDNSENATQAGEDVSLLDQLNDMKDKWIRSVAEAENIRRRAQKEKEDALKYGVTSFARDMVSVADNINRALASKPQDSDLTDAFKSFIEGVEMIAKEFTSAFEKQGLHKVPTLGHMFDPNHHQAMFELEKEGVEPGTIVEVLQEGYTLNERLIRPALVGVAKAQTPQVA
jgi:molecular chaperone GrpE